MCNQETMSFLVLVAMIGSSFAISFSLLLVDESMALPEFVSSVCDYFKMLIWALLGERLEEQGSIEAHQNSSNTSDSPAGAVLLWVYMLVAQLLLANGVLIALLTVRVNCFCLRHTDVLIPACFSAVAAAFSDARGCSFAFAGHLPGCT